MNILLSIMQIRALKSFADFLRKIHFLLSLTSLWELNRQIQGMVFFPPNLEPDSTGGGRKKEAHHFPGVYWRQIPRRMFPTGAMSCQTCAPQSSSPTFAGGLSSALQGPGAVSVAGLPTQWGSQPRAFPDVSGQGHPSPVPGARYFFLIAGRSFYPLAQASRGFFWP